MIKTVIIFLRDLLPLFILFAYLQSFYPSFFKFNRSKIWSLLLALLLILLVGPALEFSNDWFDGTGTEWLSMLMLISVLGCILTLGSKSENLKSHSIWLAVVCFTGLTFSSFALYFSVEMAVVESINTLIVSSAMGLGICISFYILWSFVLNELYSLNRSSVYALVALFVAGQTAKIVNHLHQIDAISLGSQSLGSLEHIISEQSELGHILKALVGFESAPSQLFIIVYLITGVAVFFNFQRNKL
ncbi:hypothetical protein GCM10009128_09990 [Psychrosphaera haliotis]|uniref:hypothetical protein n=1 Tax=Psychrosphaera haliotis TaxID=555083 RepID=UPI0031D4661B